MQENEYVQNKVSRWLGWIDYGTMEGDGGEGWIELQGAANECEM